MNILSTIYSMAFLIGAVAGAVLMRCAQYGQCKWLDQHHPLPDGRKRRPPVINRSWVGGLMAVGTLGYVLLQVGQTESRYEGLADRLDSCQVGLTDAINARADITSQNDALSVRQRDLLTELDDASGIWINRLINPPADIAALDLRDPRRASWSFDVTRVYYERASKLRAEIATLRAEATRLTEERSAHPLRPPSCDRPR